MHRSLLPAAALLAATALTHPASAQPAPTQNPGAAVAAPSGAPSAAAQGMRVSTADFIQRVQLSDRFEIASSRLAQQQGGAAAVKNFAAEMVRDHTQTTQELTTLVQRLGPAVMGGTGTAAQRGAAASGQAGGQAGAAADRSPAQTGAAARQSAAQAGAPGMTTAQGGIQMEGMDPEHRQIMLRLGEARGPDFDKAYIQAQVRAHQQAVDLFTAYAQSGDQADLKLWAAQTLPKLQQHLQRAQQMQQSM